MLGRGLEMHLWHDIIWCFFHRNHFAEITQTIETENMHSLVTLYILIHTLWSGTEHSL